MVDTELQDAMLEANAALRKVGRAAGKRIGTALDDEESARYSGIASKALNMVKAFNKEMAEDEDGQEEMPFRRRVRSEIHITHDLPNGYATVGADNAWADVPDRED